ncbi:MAG: hypothetical protein IPO37_25480 [Saprospiraceae bacterium]|nr:hypothetical protein [Saprospiraceae bacterium]
MTAWVKPSIQYPEYISKGQRRAIINDIIDHRQLKACCHHFEVLDDRDKRK